ncbi:hypothetical protein NQD34_015007 [Periophthalmus magnuspinnatus]|uniref:G-protein coupled receptors family 1 profile domain-containing protein n=1 Tax=Periophthalmus magnuspinnatus TaxID=409849 RepID=A0A3B3ZBT4_9GOBI|nr:atypical chemokine receptor 4b [Periophthalmus magnuspinnatus]KAJ0022873.1 hypothetical protein NQD34_015007 [Periophthalmus magnuspinnatus]
MEDYFDNDDGLNETYDYGDYHTICDKEAVRSFGSIFLPVMYAVALVVGLSGNALVVVVYTSRLRLRTLTDVCILNLAISDLLLLFTLPFWAADAVHGWRLGPAACKITSFVYSTNFSCGMLLLACISVDRYRAVAQVTRGRPSISSRPRKQWLLVCVVLWAVASFLSLPELIFSTVKHSHYRMSCTAMYPVHMARATKAALELLELILRFLVPFVVMVVCYSWVGWTLSRSGGGRRQRKWKALRVLLAVVAVFLLTQMPYTLVKLSRTLDIIYLLVTDCDTSINLDHAMQVTESLALTHACINPLLYAFMGSSFRLHILKAVKHLGQHLGSHPRQPPQEPTVEIALNNCSQVQSQSDSDDQDTSTFTI